MLDHVTIKSADLTRSKAFYDAALAPLGVGRAYEDDEALGYGEGKNVYFWLSRFDAANGSAITGTHVAFAAASRAQVDQFYQAALDAGGKDNGKPGLRPDYGENYYAAFILDPDDHNIEAVCRQAKG